MLLLVSFYIKKKDIAEIAYRPLISGGQHFC